ncbi:MAG: transcriptional repressor [Nitrospiraceae bacterium]
MNQSTHVIHDQFRRQGVRVTPQRVAIYEALASTTSHPTADALYRTVKQRHPMMSRNTVYYTLTALREAGLIQEVNGGDGVARFDANLSPHHHLMCLGCRRIMDVMDERLNSLAVTERQARGFRVVGHRVEFHGYCPTCRQAMPGKRRPAGR